jgi:hypothetical protein
MTLLEEVAVVEYPHQEDEFYALRLSTHPSA